MHTLEGVDLFFGNAYHASPYLVSQKPVALLVPFFINKSRGETRQYIQLIQISNVKRLENVNTIADMTKSGIREVAHSHSYIHSSSYRSRQDKFKFPIEEQQLL